MSAYLGKDKLVLDTSELADSDNVGAYLRSSDGTLITHTTVGSTERLDVNLGVEYSEDAAHSSGDLGAFILAVRNDSDAALTSADGDYSPIAVDEFGRVKTVTDLDVDFDFIYAEDTAHASDDLGAFVLGVYQATLASSVSADGDYGAFKFNDRGGLWTVPVGTANDDAADTENPVKVGSKSVWGALAALSATGDRANLISDKYRRVYTNNGANISIKPNTVSVDDTATALPAAALDGRRQVLIQNKDSKAIWIGDSGVTSATGLEVAARATVTLEVGQDVVVYAITSAGNTADVRVLELA